MPNYIALQVMSGRLSHESFSGKIIVSTLKKHRHFSTLKVNLILLHILRHLSQVFVTSNKL